MSPIVVSPSPPPSSAIYQATTPSSAVVACSSRAAAVVVGMRSAPATPRRIMEKGVRGGGGGGESNEQGGKNYVSVVDMRTGSRLQLPISTNTIRADSFKRIRSPSSAAVLRLYDPGYMNTAVCTSRICFIDGDKGVLRYRGYPIEELAGNAEISYEQVPEEKGRE
eukprot:GHVS01017858.1.p1 GENE.GHVS01017858.1~~GHVS01017858.1.p1  ORF type:complete len:166 (+),score=48.33 GHVS01017858.1:164-661(+)